jgi:hypothetical protein
VRGATETRYLFFALCLLALCFSAFRFSRQLFSPALCIPSPWEARRAALVCGGGEVAAPVQPQRAACRGGGDAAGGPAECALGFGSGQDAPVTCHAWRANRSPRERARRPSRWSSACASPTAGTATRWPHVPRASPPRPRTEPPAWTASRRRRRSPRSGPALRRVGGMPRRSAHRVGERLWNTVAARRTPRPAAAWGSFQRCQQRPTPDVPKRYSCECEPNIADTPAHPRNGPGGRLTSPCTPTWRCTCTRCALLAVSEVGCTDVLTHALR